jgi:CheY-like chemotaxis protein
MADPHTPNAPTIDLEVLRRLVAIGGPGLVQQMADLFSTHAPQQSAQALLAFAGGDLDGVARAAHALKSSAGNMGAHPLYQLVSGLEQDAMQGRRDRVAEQLPALQDGVLAAITALREAALAVAGDVPPSPADALASAPRAALALVEDNPDNRMLVQALLDDRYDITEYETGVEALDGIAGSPPDLVLLDISLPGMDGTEVLSRLRATAHGATVPVIALTAHAMAGDRERFLGLGFDAYVTKPIVDEQALIDTIDGLLGSRTP